MYIFKLSVRPSDFSVTMPITINQRDNASNRRTRAFSASCSSSMSVTNFGLFLF